MYVAYWPQRQAKTNKFQEFVVASSSTTRETAMHQSRSLYLDLLPPLALLDNGLGSPG
jgi:hypothetical protein